MGYNAESTVDLANATSISQKELAETSAPIRPDVTTASYLRQICNDPSGARKICDLAHVGSPKLCPSSEGSTDQREDAAPDTAFDLYTSGANLEGLMCEVNMA